MILPQRQLNQLKAYEQDLKVHEMQLSQAMEYNNPFEIEHHQHMVEYLSKKILDLESTIDFTA